MKSEPNARPAEDSGSLPDSAGEPRRAEDRLDAARLAELHALLDRPGEPPAPGAPLPPLWHAPFFRPAVRPGELGEDGAPAPDGLLPETGLPRRRRGGGRLEFLAPLAADAPATRLSVLQNVAIKQGGEAPIAVVTLRHEIAGPDGVAIREEEDVVFRPARRADDPPRPKAPLRDDRPAFSREARLDPVTVQRFCGLTGDAHRIHWDADYAREVERLPGPVAPSALLALMLAELMRDNVRRPPRSLEWRVAAHPPAESVLRLCGRSFGPSADLWITDEDGRLVLEARAALA
jgi:3-methylfumaryl-CoA hydratase